MSIRDVINDWLHREELFILTPALESDPVNRVLFVSKEIHAAIDDFGEEIDERMGRLRAHLEAFVTAEMVTVAMEPFRAKDAYMARLHPAADEVWEIRDRFSPSIRIFGCFAEPDAFVALTWQWRSVLGTIEARAKRSKGRSRAKRGWPRIWPIERRACLAEWRRKFPSYPRLSGRTPDEYLTNWFPVGDPSRWQDK
jgi:hypothetical protein